MPNIEREYHWNKGKSPTKYCYTTQDISELLSISIQHTRLLIRTGKLTPTLLGIHNYKTKHNTKDTHSLNSKVWAGDVGVRKIVESRKRKRLTKNEKLGYIEIPSIVNFFFTGFQIFAIIS